MVRAQKLIEVTKQLRERFSREVVLKPKEIAINSADEIFLERVQVLPDEKFAEPDLRQTS